MKTKMSIVCLVVGVLTSCTSDLTDNHGALVLASATFELTQEKVTADNSFYEGDLYRYYLNTEIEKTDLAIQALQKLVDNGGGDDVKKKLQLALSERVDLKAELGSIPTLLFRGVGPLPVPCPPKDDTGKCKYAGSFFIADSRVDIEGGIFFGPKKIGKFQIFQGAKNIPKGFTAYEIVTDYKEFKKEAIIKVSRSFKGKKIAITAPLFLE